MTVAGRVRLPHGVLGMARRGEQWATWVDELPAMARTLLVEWQLTLDDIAQHGNVALVLPVRTADDVPAMLKIGFPEQESEHEHLALQHWHGVGAVRLLRADPRRRAMLLERLHDRKLAEAGVDEACDVVARLYGDLHVPAPPQLRTLSSELARWTADLESLPRGAPVPRRLVEQSIAVARELAADPATDGTLVHGDLHYLNVLGAERQTWLAIDPKPLSGDPHFELAPMLWNRWDEAVATGDVRAAVRRRFQALVDTAGLDEDRARAWVVLRETLNAAWEVGEPAQGEDWITTSVTVAKAVQD